MALLIALGLLSRRYPLPGILAEYTGDALYATAAYAGYALFWPRGPSRALALLAFGSCLAVELSQAVNIKFLNDLRSTAVGAMLLGAGFKWPDLLAYLAGVSGAAVVDWRLCSRRSRGRNFYGGVGPDCPSDR